MKPSPQTYPHAGSRPITGLARARRSRNRGVALLITLILLSLLGAASVAIVLLVSSDTMINGYYRNYRGSFYAADAGVNVVVEALKSSVLGAATKTANPPLPSTVPASVTSSYSGYQSAYYSFGDSGSWSGKFEMASNPGGAAVITATAPVASPVAGDSNSCLPVGAATCTVGASTVPNDGNYNWTVSWPYQVTVKGISTGSESEVVTETGAIVYTSTSGSVAGGNPPSFSRWAAFITNFADCQGPLVPGTMTGPFFTDGQWNFGNFSNPGYTFTGSIGQAGADASWWSNNNCTDATKAPSGFTKPNFPTGGLQLNQPKIVPPADTYSQAQAVLDGKGIPPCTAAPCPTDNPPTQVQMSAELQTVTGTQYPASGSVPTAVYIPYYTGHGCANAHGCYGSYAGTGTTGNPYVNVPAGGFYVNGNAAVTLTASTGGDGTSNNTQTYAITQGGTTTTLIVDNTAGTTTMKQGGTTVTLTGVPEQLNPNTNAVMTQSDPNGSAVNPTMLYVNGSITGLTGPYSGSNPQAAVQNDVGITVAASGSVTITGDLEYVQSSLPVTIPADASVSSSNAGVLGVYTNGNITLEPHSSNGELTVDGSLAALSGQTGSSATSGFETQSSCGSNPCISTWTIVGGRAEDQAHSVSIGAGNTYYDTRFNNNFGPPWFPTAVPQAGTPNWPSSQKVSVTRSSWAETSRP
ncbi:MAG TPA: hypothetical protein VNZ56_06910 [Verrucomicrobiae bacterium]|nr:hypothetical protein [Verrucomicrobiae bacterium]